MVVLFLFSLLLTQSLAMETSSITLKPCETLYGDTFDQSVYGRDIMFLLWDSNFLPSKLFKTSKWDMLYTEKDKWVRSRNVSIAEVDCSQRRSRRFCKYFAAFDISQLKFPIIGYSIKNEPYKHFNESMEYPSLTKFLYEYFERSCVYNKNWCTENEKELVNEWRNWSIYEQLEEHHRINHAINETIRKFELKVHQINVQLRSERLYVEEKNNDQSVQNLNQKVLMLKKSLLKEQEEVQAYVDEEDEKALLLKHTIYENNADEVSEAIEAFNERYNVYVDEL